MSLLDHSCSYYCHGGVHAFQVLTRSDVPAEAVYAAGNRFYRDIGTVQAVRPALEANVDTLAQQVVSGITTQDRLIQTTKHNPQCSVAWLVFVAVPTDEREAR